MATQAQIDANRRNARKSTGPRTLAGKEASSRNATKLGLFSKHLLLPGEDPSELEAFREGIFRRLKPADEMEDLYAERIVCAAWRLQRALKGESDATARWQRYSEPADFTAVEMIQKHIASLERSMDRAMREVTRLQKQRREAQEEDAERDDESMCENEPNLVGSARIEIIKTNPIRPPGNPNDEIEPNSDPSSATQQQDPGEEVDQGNGFGNARDA
jgi:hypothetical protein